MASKLARNGIKEAKADGWIRCAAPRGMAGWGDGWLLPFTGVRVLYQPRRTFGVISKPWRVGVFAADTWRDSGTPYARLYEAIDAGGQLALTVSYGVRGFVRVESGGAVLDFRRRDGDTLSGPRFISGLAS